jgi:dihydropteroate synthase
MRRAIYRLEIAGKKVRLGERTLVVGILNVTPDSFSDGGLYLQPEKAVEHAIELAAAGADWIDVGGESTRPGSKPVAAEEELRRVLPVIHAFRSKLASVPISIDTTKAEVAEKALAAGASIINDVSGLRFDPRIAEVARRRRTGLVLMHMRGRPKTMQQRPFARDVWKSLREGLGWSVRKALGAGVRRSQIVIDPGLGFGKSRKQNYEILASLERLRSFRLPILAGSSRKSFVQAAAQGKAAGSSRAGTGERRAADLWENASMEAGAGPPSPLRFADAAAVVAAILGGAHIVRVHDVAAMLPAIRLADGILTAGK